MRTKVLVCCHANRYRSPLAAAFLSRHKHLDVRSAGFLPSGRPAGKPIREVAARMGYDISEHRSTQLSQELVDWAHKVVVMNPTQQRKLEEMFGKLTSKRTYVLLGEYYEPLVASIPDLGFISAGTDEFDRVVGMIKKASENLAKCLNTTSRK